MAVDALGPRRRCLSDRRQGKRALRPTTEALSWSYKLRQRVRIRSGSRGGLRSRTRSRLTGRTWSRSRNRAGSASSSGVRFAVPPPPGASGWRGSSPEPPSESESDGPREAGPRLRSIGPNITARTSARYTRPRRLTPPRCAMDRTVPRNPRSGKCRSAGRLPSSPLPTTGRFSSWISSGRPTPVSRDHLLRLIACDFSRQGRSIASQDCVLIRRSLPPCRRVGAITGRRAPARRPRRERVPRRGGSRSSAAPQRRSIPRSARGRPRARR